MFWDVNVAIRDFFTFFCTHLSDKTNGCFIDFFFFSSQILWRHYPNNESVIVYHKRILRINKMFNLND